MYLRGRRGIGAIALLIVLVLGALAVLPMNAFGQSNQIVGTVSDCAGSFVAGALVVLSDANGFLADQNALTAIDGVFTFTPASTGSFNLRVTRSGYFANGTTSPLRFDGTATVSHDFCLIPAPTPPKALTVTVIDASSSAPLSGALVQAYFAARNQIVASNTTNSTGKAVLTLWAATFELRTSRVNYSVNIVSVDVSAVSATTVSMDGGGVVQGHARDRTATGVFLSAGLQGYLYNPSLPNTSGVKLIRADVFGTLYRFHAPAGTYTMVVDANGHQANVSTIVITAGSNQIRDLVLKLSPREVYATTVVYGAADWNNLTIYRNLTLNPDTNLSALNPPNLRDLRLQIDYTLGNGNGIIDGTEATAFHNWLVANGPFYVTTDAFFTTNGKAYLSSTSYTVTVLGLTTPGSNVTISTSTTYSLKQTPSYIAAGAKTYSVNVTMVPDSNVSAYKDFVYAVALPRAYELNTSTVLPANAPVTTKNFQRVTIDPGVTTGTPQIRMTVSQSLNGTARAKVAAPAGKFYVQKANFTDYQAYVASNTTLTFSAEDSTDPNDHVTDANFTWRFTPTPTDIGYGIRPTFKYTSAGPFTVNVTMTETGGNKSYRDIKLFVDDRLPIAKIRTNRTGSGSANGMNLSIDEGTPVRFDGSLSTDLAYPGKNGVILDSGYAWDFNGDRITDVSGRIVNWTFRKPGVFKVNLTVTDSVGWKGTNATMNLTVNDTKAPVPAFDILDPSKDWAVIQSPMERKTIAMNASKTTDDYDKLSALNFTWTIPGPIIGRGGTNNTFWGVNISFAWKEWNNSYKVTLAVKDTGFGSHKPNTGTLNRNITVQIDPSIHADLKIELDPVSRQSSLKISPSSPEEGGLVTVSVNVTNKPNRLTASNVTTNLYAITGGVTALVQTQAQWLDKNNSPVPHTIAPGQTVKLVFTATLSGQGNKTLQVYVFDSTEPYTWLSDNKAQLSVNVRQPAWQPYAIYGSVIGIIALFVFGMYARRKIKAGEWRPIRGRRRERGEGEEKKPRKEIKEEKKRL
jgi:hypothetical protein